MNDQQDPERDDPFQEQDILDEDSITESDLLLPGENVNSTHAETPKSNSIGLSFLIVSLASFVIQSEAVQYVQGPASFYKPWFLLYVAHSSYLLCLFIQYGYYFVYHGATITNYATEIMNHAQRLNRQSAVTASSLLKRIALLTAIFNSGSLLWYISVTKISMGDVTAIYNTSCFFTYLLSVWLLRSPFKISKLIAVVTSISGICIIALFSAKYLSLSTEISLFNSGHILGYSAATLSAIFVALYEVLYAKYLVPDPPSTSFSIFITGMIGLSTLLGGLLLFPLFHMTGLEQFELPTLNQWIGISLISVLGMIFNASFMLVIAHSGPTIAAVGIILTIPLTLIVDSFHTSTIYSWNTYIGSLAIFIGYIVLHFG